MEDVIAPVVARLIHAVNWTAFRLWPSLRRWLCRMWRLGGVVALLAAIVALLLQWSMFGFRDRPSDFGG